MCFCEEKSPFYIYPSEDNEKELLWASLDAPLDMTLYFLTGLGFGSSVNKPQTHSVAGMIHSTGPKCCYIEPHVLYFYFFSIPDAFPGCKNKPMSVLRRFVTIHWRKPRSWKRVIFANGNLVDFQVGISPPLFCSVFPSMAAVITIIL